MISKLEGNVVHIHPRFIILNVQGVGYKVHVTDETQKTIQKYKSRVELWTYLAVRENALDLYGFLTQEEEEFFELLITISGIGPKTGLSILNIANVATIRRAVLTEDASYLTKTAGVGKKNAEKIVLGLRDKFVGTEEEGVSMIDAGDTLEALKAIGYAEREARDALKKVPQDITSTADRVRHAIKILGSSR